MHRTPKLRTTVMATAMLATVCGVAAQEQVAQNQFAQFDADILRQRGLDPAVADYFRRAPRFTPGAGVVAVTLNGVALGRKNAIFDAVGQLCFSPAFVRSLGLKPMAGPDGPSMDGEVTGDCPQYTGFAPRTVVTLRPAEGAIDIVTPAEFIIPLRAAVTEQGGTAALLNYRVYGLQSNFDGQASNTFRQADTTVGLNADDWILRSQQTYTQNAGAAGTVSKWRLQTAYAQKTFAEQRQVLQGGRTFTQSPLYGAIAFTGAQWFPERALTRPNNFAVTGLANSRARVEVRQNGALLYSTVVPPGPFSLNDFTLSSYAADLQVKVIEEGGGEQNFSVPASQLLLAMSVGVEEGLSFSAGRLWDVSDNDALQTDPFVTASQGWRFGDRITGVAGGLVSRSYLSGSAGVSTRLWDERQALYAQGTVARDSAHDLQGFQGTAALSLTASDSLQYGFSGNVRSRGYRTVQEARGWYVQSVNPGGYRTQISANLRWNTQRVGGITAGVTRQDYFSGDPAYIYSLGWNFSIRSAQVAIGLAHNAARNVGTITSAFVASANTNRSNYLYANLIIPLGQEATSTSYIRRSNEGGANTTLVGTAVNQRINEYVAYRAAVEKNADVSGRSDTSLSAYLLPRYTSLIVGGSQGQSRSSYYGEASGGVVLHGEGLAFSPYAVQDTFGVVRVGDVPGVRLGTPYGPVWSGPDGLTAVPALLPYHESRIEVVGKSLPDDVDVDNGLQVVQAGRGAVLRMDMGANRIRRVLLTVSMRDGTDLPAGVAVLRGGSEFFTASDSGGRVMLTDLKDGVSYAAQLPGGKLCTLGDIRIGARVEGEQFERGTARCE